MTPKGLDTLNELEGRERKVYRDVAGLPTIGVGHLLTRAELASGKIYIGGRPVKYAVGLSDKQIEDLLVQDLDQPEQLVSLLVEVPLKPFQHDALVSFVFNVGSEAFEESTLLKRLNAGKYEEVPIQLKRWIYSGGQICKGLINRRQREIEMWAAA